MFDGGWSYRGVDVSWTYAFSKFLTSLSLSNKSFIYSTQTLVKFMHYFTSLLKDSQTDTNLHCIVRTKELNYWMIFKQLRAKAHTKIRRVRHIFLIFLILKEKMRPRPTLVYFSNVIQHTNVQLRNYHCLFLFCCCSVHSIKEWWIQTMVSIVKSQERILS